MGTAEELFKLFKRKGYAAFVTAKDEQWEEGLHLDFKQVTRPSGGLSLEDRRALGEALSGFANSDGGLIIWGIDCRRVGGGPDVVQDLVPIRDLRAFLSDLQMQTSQSVSPPVHGVVHHRIMAPGERDAGFVVSLIPANDNPPHMAGAKDQHRYYRRSGGSFLVMHHHEVADLFGRRPRPNLELSCRVVPNGVSGYGDSVTADVRVVLGIKNTGRGVARFPALAIHESGSVVCSQYGLDGNGRTGLPQRVMDSGSKVRVFCGGSGDVVHPNTCLEVTRIPFKVSSDPTTAADLEIPYEIYADGFSTSGIAVIKGEEILAVCVKR